MYKGEWQRVITSRAFLDVNVGNFTLDWPMVVQVDPATRPPETFRAVPGLVDGAGWIAFSTYRKKPQLKAQATYYLPAPKAAATISSTGSSIRTTRTAMVTTGSPGRFGTPIRAPARPRARRTASGSSTR
jgi:hypothetical protein